MGAWGCFDEFNRLEERMLSAVSQQVQCIQEALREHSNPNYDKSKTSVGFLSFSFVTIEELEGNLMCAHFLPSMSKH